MTSAAVTRCRSTAGCIRSIIGCLAALSLLAGTAAQSHAGQAPEPGSERARLEAELKRYHGFINAYRAGDNASVDEILAWDPERLTKIVAAAQTPLDVFRPWDEARVKAATMLHTDAAIRDLDDDRRLGFHLSVARRLLQMAGQDIRPFASMWYAAVTRVLRDRAMLFVAEGLLEHGRELFPGDPLILYESGVLQEQIATFAAFVRETVTAIGLMRGRGAGPQNLGDTSKIPGDRNVTEQRRALENAARWLRESIRADPASELSRLHLARVDVLRGNLDEGGKMLLDLAASADTDISYLATMFLGAMHQKRGRHAEAEQMYRRASEKVPAAQSADIALSEVLQKLGRGDDSRDVLMRMLRTPALKRTEPWWWYLADPVQESGQRLDRLRTAVRQ